MNAASANYSRILFTGATGFVGHYLAPTIRDEYPDAKRLILRRRDDAVEREGWEHRDADLLDAESMEAIVAAFRPDLVLHLAAQASVGAGVEAAEATWRLNFDGALNLAAACARHVPGATFLFVSSSEVYGGGFRDGPADEDTALKPMSVYARSKAAAESMLADVLAPQAQLIVARPFNHTGPHQDRRFVMPAFAAQIAAIETGRMAPELKVGNLDASRDFLDVRDVCAAYCGLVRAAPGLPPRSVFNIGSGQPRPIRAMLEGLRALARRDFDIVVDPARLRPSDIPVAAGSSARIAAAIGWRPAIPIEATLADLLDYWREEAAQDRL